MINRLSLKYLLLTGLFVLIFSGSCKKGSNDTPTPTPVTPAEKSITLDKTTALPGDLITLTSTTSLDKESWQVKVGSKTVTLVRADDKTACFAVPYLPAGTQNIDLSSMGVTASKSITINTYTPIANPQVEISKLKADIELAKTMAGRPELALYKPLLEDFEKTFNENYGKLNDEEKKEVAYILSRQTAAVTAAQLKLNEATPSLKVNSLKSLSNADLIFTKGKIFLICVTGGIAAGDLAIINLYTPDPTFVTKAISAGLGVASFKLFLDAFQAIDDIIDLAEFEISVFAFGDQTREQSQEKVSVNSLTSNATNPTFTFSPKLPTVSFTATATFGSLSLAHKASSVNDISSIFIYTDKLQSIYNRFRNGVIWAKKYITLLPEVPPFTYPIPTNPINTVQKTITGGAFSVENISNNKINIAVTNGNKVTLRTSTTENIPTDIDFTFDLVYKNPKLGTSIRKSITANYNGAIVLGKLALISGDNQLADAGKKLAQPLVVKVTDRDGMPVAGYKVQWQITSSGGSLSATESTTNADGDAKTEFTIGSGREQYVQASVKKPDGTTFETKVVFKALGQNPWEKMLSGTTWHRQELQLYETAVVSPQQAQNMHKAGSSTCAAPLSTMVYNGKEYWVLQSPQSQDVTFKEDYSVSNWNMACHVSTPAYRDEGRETWTIGNDGYFTIKALANGGGTFVSYAAQLTSTDQKAFTVTKPGSVNYQVVLYQFTKK